MRKMLMRSVAVLSIALWAGSAQAVLIGTDVGVTLSGTYEFGDFNPLASPVTVNTQGQTDFSVTVDDAGVGVPIPLFDVDIFDTGIDIDWLVDGVLKVDATFSFFDLNWGGAGSLADVSFETNAFGGAVGGPVNIAIANFTPGGTSFDLTVDTFFRAGDFVNITFEPQHDAPVPAPATLALLGLGLLGLRLRRK